MDIIWALYTLYMHIHVWIEALMKISISNKNVETLTDKHLGFSL